MPPGIKRFLRRYDFGNLVDYGQSCVMAVLTDEGRERLECYVDDSLAE